MWKSLKEKFLNRWQVNNAWLEMIDRSNAFAWPGSGFEQHTFPELRFQNQHFSNITQQKINSNMCLVILGQAERKVF